MTRCSRSSAPPVAPAPEPLVGARKLMDKSAHTLTLHDRSVALPDNVRDLLDWLIDEELKRWQRETR